jgi:Fic family protein
MAFNPNFTITPKITKALMRIEALKDSIKGLPITPSIMQTLRETARLQSVHYSTQIEGNCLTKKEVEQVVKGVNEVGRPRDENEVKGYYAALEWLETNVSKTITETIIKTIHALVEGGGTKSVKPSSYRDAQNVIRDSSTGGIVYLPPEAKDVPLMMSDLVDWINKNSADLPIPLVAALAHYQFATIHPYYDGNGRTARLLATLVLYQGGYDLKGLYSLEEYYARDLAGYYRAISRGNNHNYYFGRETADITPWLEYFVLGMQDALSHVQKRLAEAQKSGTKDKSAILRTLTPKQRKVLTLFAKQAIITAKDIEKLFGFSERSARLLCTELVKQGFLIISNPANKNREYKLSTNYEDILAN